MVLTSTGEILTNNHVVDGATSISVQVVTTGKTYTATVVGTDPTKDIAVLQLQNASGLQSANIGDAGAVSAATVGTAVTGVGNAGGTGGVPSAASGKVVALNQSLTATDENGQNPEQLTGMIETNAPIQAGDSGGPLYDSANRVIGIDTAASTSRRDHERRLRDPDHRGDVDRRRRSRPATSRRRSTSATRGSSASRPRPTRPARARWSQAVLAGGTGRQRWASLVGDVITAVGGTSVASASDLSAAITAHGPGQTRHGHLARHERPIASRCCHSGHGTRRLRYPPARTRYGAYGLICRCPNSTPTRCCSSST